MHLVVDQYRFVKNAEPHSFDRVLFLLRQRRHVVDAVGLEAAERLCRYHVPRPILGAHRLHHHRLRIAVVNLDHRRVEANIQAGCLQLDQRVKAVVQKDV